MRYLYPCHELYQNICAYFCVMFPTKIYMILYFFLAIWGLLLCRFGGQMKRFYALFDDKLI